MCFTSTGWSVTYSWFPKYSQNQTINNKMDTRALIRYASLLMRLMTPKIYSADN